MEQAAGIVLLMVALALVLALIKNGPDGVREWIRAKFLGQAAAAAAPPAHAGGGGGGGGK